MISEEIRKLIKEERLRQGLSKDDLAERAGLSSRLIEYWEQDKRKATNIESIDKALKALGIKYTIGDSSNEPNEPNNESSDEQSNEQSNNSNKDLDERSDDSNNEDDKKVLPTFSATAHQKDDEE